MDETLKNEWISFYQHIVEEGKKKGQFGYEINDIEKLFNDDDPRLVSEIANSFLRMDDVTDEWLEWCESYREYDINEDSDDLESEIHYQLNYDLCTANEIWHVTIDTFEGYCISCHTVTHGTDFKFIEESKKILSQLHRTLSVTRAIK